MVSEIRKVFALGEVSSGRVVRGFAPFNITVIQVYAPTSNAEKAEVKWFYEDLQDLIELTPKKRCPFHCKERKTRTSRNTWSNRQIWPWSTEWSRAKACRVLPRECTGHSKHPLPTTQREDSTHGHHQMANTEIILSIFFAAKEALLGQQKQDQEVTVA